MRNKEFTNVVLELLRQHKSNKDIAEITGKHRNTISTYVNYIRDNYVRNPEEIVNKIDSKLDEDLDLMKHSDLIAYRRVLTPQKIEAKTEITEHLDARIQLDVTEDEDSILNKAASILNKKLSSKNKPASIH